MSEGNINENQLSTSNGGSVEDGISGNYKLSIRAVLSEAWDKTNGSKWTFQLAFLYYFLVFIAFIVVIVVMMVTLGSGIDGMPTDEHASAAAAGGGVFMELMIQIVSNLILLPMMMGIVMMGINRSVDRPISANSVFAYFSKTFNLFFTMLLMYIMIAVGLLLLILPGIYLMVSYYMALPLVVEKNMGPWQALETSRKAVSHHWFRMVGFFIIMGFIFMISMIPFGIGLIWTIPLFMIAYGIIYRNMFGIENVDK